MQSSKNEKVVTPSQEAVPQNHYHPMHSRKNWLVPGLLVVIALLLIGMVAHNHQADGRFDRSIGGFGMMGQHQRAGFMGGGLDFNDTQSGVRGVVTAVNGSTITIAGNGATNEVQTNSSTQYKNGSTVKVNDTVIARGSTSNGVFTATEVAVNP